MKKTPKLTLETVLSRINKATAKLESRIVRLATFDDRHMPSTVQLFSIGQELAVIDKKLSRLRLARRHIEKSLLEGNQ